jgi:pimeloyl-ACP methyl ester carboxylesterase
MGKSALSGRGGPSDGSDTFVLADGTVIAVQVSGPAQSGPAQSRTTVVLHHGWTQDHTSWEDVARILAADLRVITYDARGHGRSNAGPRGSDTIEQLADDLAQVINELVPEGPVVLAGHSLGGPVLMALAERHPDLFATRVAGAALVATSASGIGRGILGLPAAVVNPFLLVAPGMFHIRGLSRARMNTRFPAVIAQAVRVGGLYAPGHSTAHNRRRTALQVARSHPATTAALARAMIRHDRLGALRGFAAVPTIVLAGTHDVLTPIAHSRALAAALPSARFVVYPGAGHMLPYERAGEIAAEIAALLLAQDSATG